MEKMVCLTENMRRGVERCLSAAQSMHDSVTRHLSGHLGVLPLGRRSP